MSERNNDGEGGDRDGAGGTPEEAMMLLAQRQAQRDSSIHGIQAQNRQLRELLSQAEQTRVSHAQP